MLKLTWQIYIEVRLHLASNPNRLMPLNLSAKTNAELRHCQGEGGSGYPRTKHAHITDFSVLLFTNIFAKKDEEIIDLHEPTHPLSCLHQWREHHTMHEWYLHLASLCEIPVWTRETDCYL